VTRSTFVRKLKKIGDLKVPKGHARTNKGVTSYFFPHRKVEEVASLLNGLFSEPPRWMKLYCPVALAFNEDKPGDYRSVCLHIQNAFVSVGIVHWQ
jgi:hypothetical protein